MMRESTPGLMRAVRSVLAAAFLVTGLVAMPGGHVSASRLTRLTGTLTVWVVGEGATESRVAVVDTGARELRIPHGLLPDGARTGDRVSVSVAAGRVSRVGMLSQRVRSQAVPDGPRKALVIITSTTSPAAAPAPTPEQVATVMTEVDERYRSYSNNRVSFSADVATATIASASCTTFNDNIKNASAASSLATAGYTHVIVLLPSMSCGFAGLGSLGGSSVMVISPSFNKLVVTHELGHNLGLEHSATMWCGSEASPKAMAVDWSTECTTSEYGDAYSPMGATNSPSPASPQLLELGWLDPSQIALPTTGSVELSPLSGTTGNRAMVVPDPSALGAYWVEYRTAVGADTNMTNPGQVQVRFLPKSASSMKSIQTALLNTSGSWVKRLTTPGLTAVGQVFSDPTGRLSVTVSAVGATATLSVVQDPAVVSLAATGLTGTFEDNDLTVSFTAPVTGLRITGNTVTLSDASGVFETVPLATGTSAQVQAVRPGPFTLTVTTTTRDGRTGSASVDLVAPSLPEVSLAALTPTAGGAKVRLALSAPARPGTEYAVRVSRPGHPDRVTTVMKESFSLLGLPAGGRWTVTVTAKVNGLTAAPVSGSFVPKKGGIEMGRLTRKKDGSSTAVLTVPRSRRGDGLARVFLEYPGGAKVLRFRIPTTGRVLLKFPKVVTEATVSVLPLGLTPVSVGAVTQ